MRSNAATRLAKGFVLILLPEEARVPQAGAEHALVAGDDGGTLVRRLDVGDGDEEGRQRAVGALKNEVLLVGPHRGDEDLGRKGHEALVDPAEERHGPLGEALQFVEKRRIGADFEALLGGEALRARADRPSPLVAVEHDTGRQEAVAVVGEALEHRTGPAP